MLGNARRTRLCASVDDVEIWEAWDTEEGARLLLLVAARTTRDAAVQATSHDQERLRTRGAPLLAWTRALRPVLHLRSTGWLGTLRDRITSATGDASLAEAIARAGMAGLAALHREGLTHGAVDADAFVFTRDPTGQARWSLVAPRPRPATPDNLCADWRALGVLVRSLGDALEVETYAEWPPCDADDAARRIRRALATSLAGKRHEVVRRARALAARDAWTRLRGVVERLAALPFPAGEARLTARDGRRFLLRASRRHIEVSDGQHTRVLVREGTLDATATRSLVREVGRTATGDDAHSRAVMRWIVTALRLHAERVLVEAPA